MMSVDLSARTDSKATFSLKAWSGIYPPALLVANERVGGLENV